MQRFLSRISEFNHQLSNSKVDKRYDNPLLEALKKTNEVVTHDYLVVILSDIYKISNEVLKQIIRLKKNNDVIFGLISDPAEQELRSNNITLSDGEYQLLLEKDKSIRKEFRSALLDQLDTCKTDFKKYGIPLLSFSTLEDPVTQLRNMLNPKKK